MVLGKLPVSGHPANLDYIGQGPIVLAVDAGGGCLKFFLVSIILFSFSLSGKWPDID